MPTVSHPPHRDDPEFRIEIQPLSEERSRVVLGGALDAAATTTLEQAFVAEVAKGRRFFVIDLAAVTDLRSCVFGVFMQTTALVRPMNGNLTYVNAHGLAARVLKMLGADCQVT